jgi:hypothetical protein
MGSIIDDYSEWPPEKDNRPVDLRGALDCVVVPREPTEDNLHECRWQ